MNFATRKIMEECAEKAGCELIRIEDGRKHLKVYLRKGNVERFVTASVSPSDHRAMHSIVKSMKLVFVDVR